MSGGGGGGGGPSFDGDDIACERLQFETEIRSPQAAISQVKVGDVLDVTLKPGATDTIVLVLRGQEIGGLVSPKATRLRECIRAGTSYSATVIDKRAGNVVRVRITPNII
ncbi:MAG: hypothetical protein BGP24_22490 [Lysobacterales bacterium 69-70]|jgi:hypothetical protein|nr:MAG: hypothetical protein ABS97_08670 [Xanthomonadaceae bacterium SCN 69-320]ODV18577.1 MAG: hypothetical protein ABT27_13775 [Xanthomonadaceae bacterium SCN 69-25]OJY96072.1 MAG: hypothetical protein BGP24_22490 [Xanthomonadales bacterium 69-70]